MTLLFLEASHLYLDAKSTIDNLSTVDAHFEVKELTECALRPGPLAPAPPRSVAGL